METFYDREVLVGSSSRVRGPSLTGCDRALQLPHERAEKDRLKIVGHLRVMVG